MDPDFEPTYTMYCGDGGDGGGMEAEMLLVQATQAEQVVMMEQVETMLVEQVEELAEVMHQVQVILEELVEILAIQVQKLVAVEVVLLTQEIWVVKLQT
jgi:hypothetical protein